MTEPQQSRRGKNAATIGVAGVGSGTVLTYAIQTFLPDSGGLKQFLLYLVPAMSVGIGGISVLCHDRFDQWREDKEEARQRERDEMNVELVRKVLRDEDLSADAKKAAQKGLEKLLLGSMDKVLSASKADQKVPSGIARRRNTNEEPNYIRAQDAQ